jgi:4-diphosphocytidyl-2-C-methyl-D-erythritol kinase
MDRWPAPAKLNLFLHVVGRRPDGYHLLQTVFQFLDFGDELQFEVTEDDAITRAVPLAGVPEDLDLTLRAARLLKERHGVRKGVRVAVEKRLPAGGGLGGGSSDCATTLIALNELWGLRLPRAELARLGLELGADVPFFIGGRSAWAEGVGEILTPIELDEPWYLVVVPPVHVSTAEVFGASELTPHSPPITIRAFRTGLVRNDLEPIVRRRHPEVDVALAWLAAHGKARMTGSGGCVYLNVASAEAGRRILEEAPPGYGGFVARGRNLHPLYSLTRDS